MPGGGVRGCAYRALNVHRLRRLTAPEPVSVESGRQSPPDEVETEGAPARSVELSDVRSPPPPIRNPGNGWVSRWEQRPDLSRERLATCDTFSDFSERITRPIRVVTLLFVPVGVPRGCIHRATPMRGDVRAGVEKQ